MSPRKNRPGASQVDGRVQEEPQDVAGHGLLVIRTKLVIPRPKGNIIVRPRLLSSLRANLYKKLIVVVADAGYGKTTLLGHLLADGRLPSVFYSLSSEDSSLPTFLSCLVYGLELVASNLADRTRTLLKNSNDLEKNVEFVTGTLVNELAEKHPKDLFLFLDDYHNLSAESLVHKAMDLLLNNAPGSLHIVVASRTPPPWASVARWRSKQEVFELSREDLRFTAGELESLVADAYQTRVGEEELRRLANHTEGWITGIQLILQAAGKERNTIKETINGYLEADQPLFEYFASEVVMREPEAIRRFLEKCAILEIISPEACDAIFEMADARALLERVEKRHLFLQKVDKDRYRLHPLFQEFLLRQAKEPASKRFLAARAAEYYYRINEIDRSIQYHLMAEDYESAGKRIIELFDRGSTGQHTDPPSFLLLKHYLERLPDWLIVKVPRLLNMQAMILRDEGKMEKAEEVCLAAARLAKEEQNSHAVAEALAEHALVLFRRGAYRQALPLLRRAQAVCPPARVALRSHINNLLGMVWQEMGNLDKGRAYLVEAKREAEKLPDAGSSIIVQSNLATLLLRHGETELAFESFEPLIEKLRGRYYFKIGTVFANAARAALDCGRTAWAERCLEEGWTICRAYEDRSSHAALHHGLGLLCIQQRQWALALEHLAEARDGFRHIGWTRMEFNALRNIGNLRRHQGDARGSRKYFDAAWRLLKNNLDETEGILAAFLLADEAMLALGEGHPDRARRSIQKCHRLSKKLGWQSGEFYSYFVSAGVALSRRNQPAAQRLLARAIDLSTQKGYDGILKSEFHANARLVPLLRRMIIGKRAGASLDSLKSLLRSRLTIRLFGGIRIETGENRSLPLEWSTEKAKSLFTCLVYSRKVGMRREVILEQLWPDVPKKKALENFRTTAYRMRQTLVRALAGRIEQSDISSYRHGIYRLLPEVDLEVDTEQFDEILREAETADDETKAAKLKQALDLCRGDLVPEIYDVWTDPLRRGYDEKRRQAFRWLARHLSRIGDAAGCADYCERYLALAPSDEEMARLHMENLARLGRVEAISDRYNKLRKALKQELGREPSNKTEDLYHSLVHNHLKL